MSKTPNRQPPRAIPGLAALDSPETLRRLAPVVVLLALGLLALVPLFPASVQAWLTTTTGPFLNRPVPAVAEGFPLTPRPLSVWLRWLLAAGGVWVVLGLLQHGIALHVQTQRPATHSRTTLRVRVPPVVAFAGQKDGVALLRQLIALLPPTRLQRGDPVPLVLRWSGRPERPVCQSISLAGHPDRLITPITTTLLGLAPGTEVTPLDDPLTAALAAEPDAVLCWCTVTAAGGAAFPLHIPEDRASPVIEALIPALAPQVDVLASDLQLLIRQPPRTATPWRPQVQALLAALKGDASSREQRMVTAKAEGPVVATTIRLVAVARTPAAGTAMLHTLAGALAATAQRIGSVEQRLVAGPITIQTPTPPPTPIPVGLRWGLWVAAILSALAIGLHGWRAGVPLGPWWALVLAPLAIPDLLLTAWAAARGAHRHQAVQAILGCAPPVCNPLTVPLWGPWFGRAPWLLSGAELATLWQPPAPSLGDRVERVPSRWIDAPSRVFIDPANPAHIALGMGRKSDGSWAPIGLDYADFRFIAHITAPMGRGKSEYLRGIFQQLMRANAPAILIDCKAKDLVDKSLPLVPLSREGDVLIHQLGGTTLTGEDLRSSMNLLSAHLGRSLNLSFSAQASTVIKMFALLEPRFAQMPGVQQFANLGVLALLEGEPHATLLHLIRFYGDEDYRAEVCSRVRTPQVSDFWLRRFPLLDSSSTSSLQAFERRLDRMLSYPELSAMLIAPGCSIDVRQVMDQRGILLFGVSPTEGDIASIGSNLLLMQILLAAMSRSTVPEAQRPDVPLFIDEAHIALEDNPELAKIMFSQFRSFRVGPAIVHQNMGQLPPDVLTPLAGNAQTRIILGAREDDAQQYARAYAALGLTAQDFLRMEQFTHQYVEIVNSGLFTCAMRPPPASLQEEAPPPVYAPWHLQQAPARTAEDREIDAIIRRFAELQRFDRDDAVRRLAGLPLAVYDAYCARTKAHRWAQRQFILDHPGCIRPPAGLDAIAAQQEQKDRRIRILSALKIGTPTLETEALAYRLLFETAQADARRAAKEAEAKGAKGRGRKGAGATHGAASAAPTVVAPDPVLGVVPAMEPHPPGAAPIPPPNATAMPTLAELLAARGARRAAGDYQPLGGLADDDA